MEGLNNLPNNVINLIFRFSSHPIADLLKPCIIETEEYNIIHSNIFYYKSNNSICCRGIDHQSYHNIDSTTNQFISERMEKQVISSVIKHKLNITYLKDHHLNLLNPIFVHVNKAIINDIILEDFDYDSQSDDSNQSFLVEY